MKPFAALIVLALLSGAAVTRTHAAIPPDTLASLGSALRDSATAAASLPRLRAWAAAATTRQEKQQTMWALQNALYRTHGPAGELVATVDSMAAMMPDPFSRGMQWLRAASELSRRGERRDDARRYAEAAIAASEQIQDLRDMVYGEALQARSRLQWAAGATDSALATLERAIAVNREDQFEVMRELRLELAERYEQSKRTDDGLMLRVQVAGTWGSADTSAHATLRRQWIARHGSLAGLDAAVTRARERSHQVLVFEAPRVDREIPDIRLPELAGDSVSLGSLRGHLAVVDFWGTWCGPCVESMPKIQALHEKYGPRGVRVLGFGVEFQPKDLKEARQQVGEFMKKHRLTFPTLIDLHGKVGEGLAIPAFPTIWVVDRTGRVRFQNAGSSEVTGRVVEEQLESLLR